MLSHSHSQKKGKNRKKKKRHNTLSLFTTSYTNTRGWCKLLETVIMSCHTSIKRDFRWRNSWDFLLDEASPTIIRQFSPTSFLDVRSIIHRWLRSWKFPCRRRGNTEASGNFLSARSVGLARRKNAILEEEEAGWARVRTPASPTTLFPPLLSLCPPSPRPLTT